MKSKDRNVSEKQISRLYKSVFSAREGESSVKKFVVFVGTKGLAYLAKN